jgi:hypothetical protein
MHVVTYSSSLWNLTKLREIYVLKERDSCGVAAAFYKFPSSLVLLRRRLLARYKFLS